MSSRRTASGRGFGFTGGHNHRSWQNDGYRKIILNAILWTAKVDVPALEEDEDAVQTLKVPSGTQNGETLVIRGAGVPRLNGRGRGDLICLVEVDVPKKLTREQKRLLKELDGTFE